MRDEIELWLRDPEALFVFDAEAFDPFDPRALDRAGVEEILTRLRAAPLGHALRVTVVLPPDRVDPASDGRIRAGLAAYVERQARELRSDYRDFVRNNIVFGVVAVVVVAAALALGYWMERGEAVADLALRGTIQIGIDVLIWVALWAPVSAFMQDWLPYFRRRQALRRLAALPIVLRTGTSTVKGNILIEK